MADGESEGDTRHCLDLFSGFGGFSSAFEDSPNWDVTTVDIEEEFEPDIKADILELTPDDLPNADVILASPPCKDFSFACQPQKWDRDGHRRPLYVPKIPEIAKSISIVYHTLWLIWELDPDYWFLENPKGMLRQLIGQPTGHVHYCQYGKKTKKPTDLWGFHPQMRYQTCDGRVGCHISNPRNENKWRDYTRAEILNGDYAAERAKVPYELSKAILQAVERPASEQSTLTEMIA